MISLFLGSLALGRQAAIRLTTVGGINGSPL